MSERDISLTFAKGLSVLKAFDTGSTHLTVAQIARETGLDRAVTRRLVLTLVHLGYVRQRERLYSLTPGILVLAGGFLQAHQFGKTIQPVMRSFSGQICEAISMAMIDGDRAVYVAHAGAAAGTVSLGFTVGSKVPLLSTAIGRALLSALPEGERAALVDAAPLVRHTAATNLDRGSIAEAVATAADQGFALVEGEFEAGVAAIAVPVVTAEGDVAALGISANAARLADLEHRQRVTDGLRECAKAVAGLL